MHEGKVKISTYNDEWISTPAIIFIVLPAYLSANRAQLQFRPPDSLKPQFTSWATMSLFLCVCVFFAR